MYVFFIGLLTPPRGCLHICLCIHWQWTIEHCYLFPPLSPPWCYESRTYVLCIDNETSNAERANKTTAYLSYGFNKNGKMWEMSVEKTIYSWAYVNWRSRRVGLSAALSRCGRWGRGRLIGLGAEAGLRRAFATGVVASLISASEVQLTLHHRTYIMRCSSIFSWNS